MGQPACSALLPLQHAPYPPISFSMVSTRCLLPEAMWSSPRLTRQAISTLCGMSMSAEPGGRRERMCSATSEVRWESQLPHLGAGQGRVHGTSRSKHSNVSCRTCLAADIPRKIPKVHISFLCREDTCMGTQPSVHDWQLSTLHILQMHEHIPLERLPWCRQQHGNDSFQASLCRMALCLGAMLPGRRGCRGLCLEDCSSARSVQAP